MSELLPFLDTDGQLRPRSDFDYHHVVPQSASHGKGERDFINLEGLKMPLFKEWHNLGATALHKNVGLCPMPGKELRHIIRSAIYEVQDVGVYDRFLYANEIVHEVADYSHNTGLAKEAHRIGQNWEAQSKYILLGQVREAQS